MIRFAVCDDDKTMCDMISKYACDAFSARQIKCVVSKYNKGSLLLKAIENEIFDLLFLDIMMPNIDGFEIADILRQKLPQMQIIFITANNDLVFKSFDYHPFYFIRKGTGSSIADDICKSINLLLERRKQYSIIDLESIGLEKISVTVKDIIYIENAGHYLMYHIAGLKQIKIRGTADDVLKTMEQYDFIRIHRRYIVNLAHVKTCGRQRSIAFLSNGAELEIGRKYKDEFEEMFRKYIRICNN